MNELQLLKIERENVVQIYLQGFFSFITYVYEHVSVCRRQTHLPYCVAYYNSSQLYGKGNVLGETSSKIVSTTFSMSSKNVKNLMNEKVRSTFHKSTS